MEKYKLKDILIDRRIYATKSDIYPHVTLSKDGIYDKSKRYDRDFLVKDEDKKYKITKLNDICYNPANLKFGVICLNEYGTAIFSPIYITFELKEEYKYKINIKYLSYILTSYNFIEKVRKYEQGTVYERMSVSPEDFLRMEIKLPNINEQDRIVEFLEKIEKIINNINKNIVYHKKIKKTIFKTFYENISCESTTQMEKLGKFFKGNGLSKSDISDSGKECILYGELYTKYKEVTRCIYSKTLNVPFNPVYTKKYDVLIPSSGETDVDISTATCVLKDNIIIGGDLNVFRLNDIKEVNGIYISYVINYIKKYEIARLAQGFSVVHLYSRNLDKLKIKIPYIEKQENIVKVMEIYERRKELLEKNRENMKKLKRGIIQKILN